MENFHLDILKMLTQNNHILKALQVIPGVGASIARDLISLGVSSVDDLTGANPDAMYGELCAMRGQKLDRCLLYVFRCAVYFASNEVRDPELMKWWNWKDDSVIAFEPRGH